MRVCIQSCTECRPWNVRAQRKKTTHSTPLATARNIHNGELDRFCKPVLDMRMVVHFSRICVPRGIILGRLINDDVDVCQVWVGMRTNGIGHIIHPNHLLMVCGHH
jgi:hypothetical protein